MTARPGSRRLRRPGIRLTATLVAAAVVGSALLLGGVALVVLVHRSLVGSVDAAGMARARDVAALAQAGRLSATVASIGEESSVVQVIAADGSVVSASDNISGDTRLLAAPPRERVTVVVDRPGLPIGNNTQSFRVVAEPVTLPSGPGWVYVASSLAQVDLTTTRVAGLLGLGFPLLLAVATWATWGAVGRALRPVEHIRARAAQIRTAEPGARVPVPASDDEIARLARTMNEMLGRIEDSVARQRQFVGDASHELRSPLATLRTQAEVALSHPEESPPVQALARIRDQADRMGSLIDDLLFLARADEGRWRSGTDPVDLDELLLAEVARLRGTGVPVRVAALEAARLTGSRVALARLLHNLGDNAAGHAASEVLVELRATGGEAVLTVADDGPGIPVEQRERVFERFVRLEESRVRPTVGAGVGLGLAIAAQIVSRHGGRIEVTDRADGRPGAAFVVRLPAASPERGAPVAGQPQLSGR